RSVIPVLSPVPFILIDQCEPGGSIWRHIHEVYWAICPVVLTGILVGFQSFKQRQDRFGIPARSAYCFPKVHIFSRWVERDTRVMRGTTPEHFSSGMAHKGVTVFLFFDGVVPVHPGFQ